MNALVIYWVTLKSSDQHDRPQTMVPGIASRSKSEDPEAGGTGPSTRSSKVAFKLGRSKQDSPDGPTNMQVIFCREPFAEIRPTELALL